jgi:hypothetical protein
VVSGASMFAEVDLTREIDVGLHYLVTMLLTGLYPILHVLKPEKIL